MRITERSRNVMYTRFFEVLGDEEVVQDMLSVYPATELDEPASRAFIEAQMTEVRTEMAGIRTSMSEMEARLIERIHVEVNGSRSELRDEISSLRSELKGDIAGLRSELKGDIVELRSELKGDIAELGAELKGDIGRLEEGLGGLRSELKGDIAELGAEMRRLTHWAIGVVVTLIGMVVALAAALVGTQLLMG